MVKLTNRPPCHSQQAHHCCKTRRDLTSTWCHLTLTTAACVQWLGGKFSGAGMEKFADGTFYLGEYEAGLATGLGISIYADGSLHEGQVSCQLGLT